MPTQQIALAPEISTWPDENPHLIGSACGKCGATVFPVQERCPKCSAGGDVGRAAAAARHPGRVDDPGLPARPALRWAPTGKDFAPFGVGLVQLGWTSVIRVEGRLTESDPAKLQFGMEVELTMVPFYTDDDGNEIVTFAFQPVEAGKETDR